MSLLAHKCRCRSGYIRNQSFDKCTVVVFHEFTIAAFKHLYFPGFFHHIRKLEYFISKNFLWHHTIFLTRLNHDIKDQSSPCYNLLRKMCGLLLSCRTMNYKGLKIKAFPNPFLLLPEARNKESRPIIRHKAEVMGKKFALEVWRHCAKPIITNRGLWYPHNRARQDALARCTYDNIPCDELGY